jgi:uncharacterized protein YqeY
VNLTDRLQQDLTRAMRERDDARRDALRMAVNAVYNAAKVARRPLTDDEVVALLGREIKTRRETIEAYAAAGRADTVAHEQAALEVISAYLPEQLPAQELAELVREAVDETGASSAREMGKVMAALMPRVRGRADGKAVSAAVAAELAKRDLGSHGH